MEMLVLQVPREIAVSQEILVRTVAQAPCADLPVLPEPRENQAALVLSDLLA